MIISTTIHQPRLYSCLRRVSPSLLSRATSTSQYTLSRRCYASNNKSEKDGEADIERQFKQSKQVTTDTVEKMYNTSHYKKHYATADLKDEQNEERFVQKAPPGETPADWRLLLGTGTAIFAAIFAWSTFILFFIHQFINMLNRMVYCRH